MYFPQLEVVGDVGNTIWHLAEAIESQPESWDLRYALTPCYRPRLGGLLFGVQAKRVPWTLSLSPRRPLFGVEAKHVTKTLSLSLLRSL